MSAPRTGIFGGTFDPVHIGHLALAEAIGQTLNLGQVIFFPAGNPPHKPGKPRSDARDRYRMVELAIADNERFAISDLDMGESRPSYTVDLLRLIQARFPNTALEFIIGADSLRDFPSWHDPEGILRMCRLAVGSRQGVEVEPATVIARVPALAERLDLITTPRLDVSASEIRARATCGQSIRYLVPDPVWRYIRDNRLYQRPTAGSRGEQPRTR